MKKLFLIIGILFMMSCTSKHTTNISQNVSYDNIVNNYSITTTFTYPNYYNACVYCNENKIDSVKRAEMNKAKHIQDVMILKID